MGMQNSCQTDKMNRNVLAIVPAVGCSENAVGKKLEIVRKVQGVLTVLSPLHPAFEDRSQAMNTKSRFWGNY